MADPFFSALPDDVILNIFFKLQDDPRNWARLACVCSKFSFIIRDVCCKAKCRLTIPDVLCDIVSTSSSSSAGAADQPPGGWVAFYKLAVCCPGLLHSGVLLENSDFGLERELGPEENFPLRNAPDPKVPCSRGSSEAGPSGSHSTWTLFDDLYYDTIPFNPSDPQASIDCHDDKFEEGVIQQGYDYQACKRRKACRSMRSHLASGAWSLSREQGNKLLASRFRGDCLYISDWPGCVHIEEKRNYMLFRGVFKNFKRSRVWRTIKDGNGCKLDMNCAFCSCKETWELHSAFCLKRGFGYHDDGEPVVRAYVCENGHVSGAWTDLPLFT